MGSRFDGLLFELAKGRIVEANSRKAFMVDSTTTDTACYLLIIFLFLTDSLLSAFDRSHRRFMTRVVHQQGSNPDTTIGGAQKNFCYVLCPDLDSGVQHLANNSTTIVRRAAGRGESSAVDW